MSTITPLHVEQKEIVNGVMKLRPGSGTWECIDPSFEDPTVKEVDQLGFPSLSGEKAVLTRKEFLVTPDLRHSWITSAKNHLELGGWLTQEHEEKEEFFENSKRLAIKYINKDIIKRAKNFSKKKSIGDRTYAFNLPKSNINSKTIENTLRKYQDKEGDDLDFDDAEDDIEKKIENHSPSVQTVYPPDIDSPRDTEDISSESIPSDVVKLHLYETESEVEFPDLTLLSENVKHKLREEKDEQQKIQSIPVEEIQLSPLLRDFNSYDEVPILSAIPEENDTMDELMDVTENDEVLHATLNYESDLGEFPEYKPSVLQDYDSQI